MRKIIFFLMMIFGCTTQEIRQFDEPEIFHQVLEKVTEVIIHDIFSPPVSSRIYAYVSIAAYEAFIPNQTQYRSLENQLNGFEHVPKPEASKKYNFALASVKAIMTVARTLTFSVEKYNDFEKSIYQKFNYLPADIYENSIAYGEQIGKYVLAYAKDDNYLKTRGLRYTVKQNENKWQPTPPQYADGMEPYWHTIRTMVLDSAGQFPAPAPFAFSKEKNSDFWKELMEVYHTVNSLTEEQKKIALFWDDNAFVMNVQGHVAFADKKMTPAGHWMAITRTVCRLAKKNSAESIEAYLRVALALHEGFIACWNEKYKYEKIRPETAINQFLDTKWTPFLQSPPFPEYTSGHSTISAASAEALTYSIGDNIAFTDSTEFPYNHGVRSFDSFRKAAAECSLSRVYGGIHYTSGCREGLKMGEKIGRYINEKIVTRK
ncbi:vanadium-dependent haloperoxidase [Thermoflexibacter ruber]|uniref:PAP2 superfamily protein n=1 Tax=Thermoflexibacter ruber TaxID=1003 RepID=A0A1I2HEQ9_9BACT|nr:vanadium-dependent haloperoxidase [Thermoflexibacter ruber]SFF28089.1 PAP2 superfamily protein [Thermoflexibacter ruber]